VGRETAAGGTLYDTRREVSRRAFVGTGVMRMDPRVCLMHSTCHPSTLYATYVGARSARSEWGGRFVDAAAPLFLALAFDRPRGYFRRRPTSTAASSLLLLDGLICFVRCVKPWVFFHIPIENQAISNNKHHSFLTSLLNPSTGPSVSTQTSHWGFFFGSTALRRITVQSGFASFPQEIRCVPLFGF
jgi:hypothetical protein